MQEILNKVAQELNLPKGVVKETYNSFFRFIKERIEELPLKEDLTTLELSKLKTNFNIPYIGKLYVTENSYNAVKKKYDCNRRSKTKV